MEKPSPLLTDLYQINMIQAYLEHGDTETAVFELFARTLPSSRGFLMAAGLEQALEYLETLRFSPGDVAWQPLAPTTSPASPAEASGATSARR